MNYRPPQQNLKINFLAQRASARFSDDKADKTRALASPSDHQRPSRSATNPLAQRSLKFYSLAQRVDRRSATNTRKQ
ncbi:hypothetical protein A2U01_0085006, partial [Trifolium medium]|nr:hypothetical protein [Trifolium medium]